MIESALKTFVDTANAYIWQFPEQFPWMVFLLLCTGIFITFRMGWINIRYFRHAIRVIRGKYDDPDDEGDINHFQALSTALSATVGVGNIAGVATAIHYGGPGTIFWLWISGLFGMTLKFAESTLSMHYRTFDEKGNASGGPMYYIEKGLGKQWKWLAASFAGLTIISSFGIGCMNQSNTVAVSAASALGAPAWIVGLIVAVMVALVIIGGIKRIGAVSSRLMPGMAVIYILGALIVLFRHVDAIPGIFKLIVSEAMHPSAALGGSAAGIWNLTMLWGIKRALFSNEAGMGSAPIAHAAAKTKEPVREGVVAMLGPFVDTLVICTLTGLVIIATGVWDQKKMETMPFESNAISVISLPDDSAKSPGDSFSGAFTVRQGVPEKIIFHINDGVIANVRLLSSEGMPLSGMYHYNGSSFTDSLGGPVAPFIEGKMLQNSSALTAWAFFKGFGRFGPIGLWVVTLSVFLFALSTMISWSYYGDRCVVYLFGVKYVIFYRIAFVILLYAGSVLSLETVWAYGDMALGLMTVPNLVAILLLSPQLVRLSKEYFTN